MSMPQLMRKVRLMVATGIVRLVDDARKIQQAQVTLLDGEVRDQVNRMQNYGHSSNPLTGAEALALAVGGNRNHMVVVVVDDGRHRKKDLEPGEHALYHHEGDYIHFKNGRIIEVLAGTKLRVTAPEVEIIASTSVTITSPNVNLSGNLTAQGTVQGNAVRTASFVQLGTHVHGGVQGGASNSGTPVV